MDAFVGELRTFAFGIVPKGWAVCNGALLNVSNNQALFSLLGTTFGGNGNTTFALPDLRGKTMLHTGNAGGTYYPMGGTAGSEKVTLTATQIPMHNHMLRVFEGLGSTPLGNADDYLTELGVFTGNQQSTLYAVNGYVPAATNMTALQPNTISPAGANQPHNNMQPFMAMNICIALQGIYPSRG